MAGILAHFESGTLMVAFWLGFSSVLGCDSESPSGVRYLKSAKSIDNFLIDDFNRVFKKQRKWPPKTKFLILIFIWQRCLFPLIRTRR